MYHSYFTMLFTVSSNQVLCLVQTSLKLTIIMNFLVAKHRPGSSDQKHFLAQYRDNLPW